MKVHVKDTVLVTAGKDKGKKGAVKAVFPKTERVVVEGLNLFKRHLKPKDTGKQGEIVSRERPLPIARLMLICPHCGKPTRVGLSRDTSGQKVRLCRRCQKPIGAAT